jgi:phage anti-repressor protein
MFYRELRKIFEEDIDFHILDSNDVLVQKLGLGSIDVSTGDFFGLGHCLHYAITGDTFKHMALAHGTAKGRRMRLRYIKIEQLYRNVLALRALCAKLLAERDSGQGRQVFPGQFFTSL